MPEIYDKFPWGKSTMKKICIIPGTRPEIIKMSPVVRACEGRGLEWFMIHTGQHYSYNMDRVFFEERGLPEAGYNLDVGSGRHGGQTGRMLAGIEKILIGEKPYVVLVGGDMGGAGRRFVEGGYDFSTATRLKRRITFKCEEV
jgi:UDP-N-acetylglucosamine 2-epimerase